MASKRQRLAGLAILTKTKTKTLHTHLWAHAHATAQSKASTRLYTRLAGLAILTNQRQKLCAHTCRLMHTRLHKAKHSHGYTHTQLAKWFLVFRFSELHQLASCFDLTIILTFQLPRTSKIMAASSNSRQQCRCEQRPPAAWSNHWHCNRRPLAAAPGFFTPNCLCEEKCLTAVPSGIERHAPVARNPTRAAVTISTAPSQEFRSQ